LFVVSPDSNCAFHTLPFFSGVTEQLARWVTAARIALFCHGDKAVYWLETVQIRAGRGHQLPVSEAGPLVAQFQQVRKEDHNVLTAGFCAFRVPALLALLQRDGSLRVDYLQQNGTDGVHTSRVPDRLVPGTAASLDPNWRIVVSYADHFSPAELLAPVSSSCVAPPCTLSEAMTCFAQDVDEQADHDPTLPIFDSTATVRCG
jgi:hypothetical protein